MKKRILAILLAVVMVVSLLPAMAFADDVVTTADDEIVESEEPTETGTPDGTETPTEPAETPEGTETPAEPAETPEGTETPAEPAEPTDGTETPAEPAETPDGTETPAEPAEPEKPAITFTDVPAWCEEAVSWAVSEGITNGTDPVNNTTFSPNDTCKNVEILTMLWRAAGKRAAEAASPFTVASYYQDAVDWAYEEGMIDDDTIPDAHCTRANALSYIWQAFSSPSVEGETGFPDVSADAACASAVIWGVSNGITNGYTDGTFGPSIVCSRAEIVTFLYRADVEDARLPV